MVGDGGLESYKTRVVNDVSGFEVVRTATSLRVKVSIQDDSKKLREYTSFFPLERDL